MNKDNHPTYETFNIKRSTKTMCRCKLCDARFDYKERSKKAISFGMTRDACPKCGGSFVVISWNSVTLGRVADSHMNDNPNNDQRMYNMTHNKKHFQKH